MMRSDHTLTHAPHRARCARAFTLIELLVVVTVIVILIALLTPALDRAMYLAELTSCGARQHGVAMNVQLYAMDFRRAYPYPPGGRHADSFDHIGPRVGDGLRFNPGLVTLFEPRFSLDTLQCPLLGGISYDPSDNIPETNLYSNYYLFFSQRYTDAPGNRGMYRIGDAMEYRTGPGADPITLRVMLMDLNGADTTGTGGAPYAMTGHPDTTGTLPKRTWQNVMNITAVWVTFARWQVGTQLDGDYRGPVDLNFTWEDGATRRMDQLARVGEDRTVRLPYYPGGSGNLDIYVPPGR